jgi:L,D-peptidoglycan transpeptidase YkuD (ErfK/YbiS/YcfS/YnhG family)
MRGGLRSALLAALTMAGGCTSAVPPASAPRPMPTVESPTVGRVGAAVPARFSEATQLLVVTTPGWDSTGGHLRRYERAAPDEMWRPVGEVVPVVVGSAGLGWDDTFDTTAGAPRKREGDGRAPAGVFPIDTVFGFAPAGEAGWIRAPYLPLTAGSECVDDVRSAYYNTVVDRSAVPRVDWSSAERMREIEQYRIGAMVEYNAAPPRAGRGSCIFLHVWGGPGTSTAGCTAMPERALREVVLWLDRARRPMLVQLPLAELARLHGSLLLP